MGEIRVFTSMMNTLNVDHSTFPGGEVHVRIKDSLTPDEAKDFTIRAIITGSEDIMRLMMTTDAIRRKFNPSHITLILPYVPYARQDRICNEGEAFSLEVFALLINDQNYDAVVCWDAHSKVTSMLIEGLKSLSFADLFPQLALPSNTIIVAPDAGAFDRASNYASKHGFSRVFTASKVRNLATTEIIGTEVRGDGKSCEGWNFLIVDDICDGGKTFIELAKVLRKMSKGRVELAVTHGIFSKGLSVLREHIDHVYTKNSFISEVELKALQCNDFVTLV